MNVHYMPLPIHPSYRAGFQTTPEACPRAAAVSEQIVSLPIFPSMSENDISDVINAVVKVTRGVFPGMKIVAIIQARMGSTRLPGKVLLDLAGKPVLERVVRRCRRAAQVDEVIIATTLKAADDPIMDLCVAQKSDCYRGSEDDVLDRYYQAARWSKAETVVRITADCPLVEPEVIQRCVGEFLEPPAVDYAANTLPPRTFPRGLDVEVFSFAALERAWQEDGNPAWREHVTPYIYRHPEVYRLRAVVNDVDYSDMRWCVDTQEDLALVRNIYGAFGTDGFSWREVVTLLQQNPQWLELNRAVVQKELL